MNFDDYIKNREDVPTTNGKQPKPSPDWMPGVEMKSGKGSITTKAIPQGNPNWNEWIDFWLGKDAHKDFYVR